MNIFLKACVGFVVVLLIQLAARSKYYVLSALLPLFPSLAIFSYYAVGSQYSAARLQETIVFGMVSLLTYFGFLLGLLFFSRHMDIVRALWAASGVWGVCAAVQIVLWNKFH